MKKNLLIFSSLVGGLAGSLLTLTSCSTQEPAQIEYGSKIHTSASDKGNSSISRKKWDDSYNDDEQFAQRRNEDEDEVAKKGHYLKIKENPDNDASDKRFIDEESEVANHKSAKKDEASLDDRLEAELRQIENKNKAKDDTYRQPNGQTKLENKLDVAGEDQDTATSLKGKNIHDEEIAESKTLAKSEEKARVQKSDLNPDTKSDAKYDTKSNQGSQSNSEAKKNIDQDAGPIVGSDVKIARPVQGRIVNRFGDVVKGSKLQGVDFEGKAGEPVKACASGLVTAVGRDDKFGNRVIIRHEDGGLQSAYAHLGDVIVSKGQMVRAGDEIGTVGQTGDVTSPMLHFAVRKNNAAIDPAKLLQR